MKQQSWANICWVADMQQPTMLTGSPEIETAAPVVDVVEQVEEKPGIDWSKVNADFSR